MDERVAQGFTHWCQLLKLMLPSLDWRMDMDHLQGD
jgi:hypothetical protein